MHDQNNLCCTLTQYFKWNLTVSYSFYQSAGKISLITKLRSDPDLTQRGK